MPRETAVPVPTMRRGCSGCSGAVVITTFTCEVPMSMPVKYFAMISDTQKMTRENALSFRSLPLIITPFGVWHFQGLGGYPIGPLLVFYRSFEAEHFCKMYLFLIHAFAVLVAGEMD